MEKIKAILAVIDVIFNWLNGKKTTFGWICNTVAGLFFAYYETSRITPDPWISRLIGVLFFIGTSLGVAGTAHKYAKGEFSNQ